jgi:glycosyltransferase involved in cell wall biosynthesis
MNYKLIMLIVVNTRLLLKNKLEGIGWFEYETLKRITIQHPECEFIFVFDRKFDDSFIFSPNITPVIAFPQARHPFLYYLWFEYSIPGILKKYKPDLFLSPDGYLPLKFQVSSSKFQVKKHETKNMKHVKLLPVIHDLNFEHFPENLPFLTRHYYRHFFPRFAHSADRIVTVSEFSKQDIVSTYKIDPDLIDVVYNGANKIYKPVDLQVKAGTLNKYSAGMPYFVFVGSLHSRKNITGLLKAFDKYRVSSIGYREKDMKLLIVGEKRWWTSENEDIYQSMKYRDDVIFLSRLSCEELNKVIASAEAMVYPSFFEGFGIPVVEAFYCGIPVIASGTSSLPEVAGDAALFVDPHSSDSICNAMQRIVNDNDLRNSLISKGNIRKLAFSWQKTANGLWESILKTI